MNVVDVWLSGPDSPTREALHDSDCFACHAAAHVVDVLAFDLDPLQNWSEVTCADGVAGDSVSDRVHRMVAFTLHRMLPGHEPSQVRAGAR